jgi:uncharacterized protein
MPIASQFKVSKLYRYPVKSLGAEEVDAATLCPVGFVGDRRYALQEVETGIICSAKIPKKYGALLEFSARYLAEPSHEGPLPPIEIRFPDGRAISSEDPGLDAALSEFLGIPVRLISQSPGGSEVDMMWRITEGHKATQWTEDRKIGEEDGQDKVRFKLAGEVPQQEHYDTFFDLSPIHFMTTSTLHWFEQQEPEVNFHPMRFRPNMILEGPDLGLAEQTWSGKRMLIDDTDLYVDFPTVRCGMPSLPQKRLGLELSRKTIQAVARHNTLRDALGPGDWACVGAYCSPRSGGTLKVGSDVMLDA